MKPLRGRATPLYDLCVQPLRLPPHPAVRPVSQVVSQVCFAPALHLLARCTATALPFQAGTARAGGVAGLQDSQYVSSPTNCDSQTWRFSWRNSCILYRWAAAFGSSP